MKKRVKIHPTLSVALATYNEEANIVRCLNSVKGWVDEIIIVDGSSADKTRELASKFGVVVVKTTNKPIFHINKQLAIDNCQGLWVLQLDADEVVSETLKDEILSVIKKGSEDNAFWIPRKNYFLGRWLRKTGQYPDPVIRFFKKGMARLPCRSVHEQITVKGGIGSLRGHLLHYPYPSFSEYLKKSDRYTSLTAGELLKAGEKANFSSFLKAYFRFEKDFWLRFLRHKGFLDGFPGLIFSAYSGLHNITAYVKFWELYRKKGSN
ncbi:glycosyltransferase family 2 protein [Patescibacteria group bacterium]|nr:glycosyltransferase family 2 protein [Patescibacteria group bacterium]